MSDNGLHPVTRKVFMERRRALLLELTALDEALGTPRCVLNQEERDEYREYQAHRETFRAWLRKTRETQSHIQATIQQGKQ